MTSTQMRYLIAITEKDNGEKRSIADVSRLYDVNRSTVSRALTIFVSDGILDDNYDLTDYGKIFIKTFKNKYDSIRNWLISRGVSEEKAFDDAMIIATGCSDETSLLISQSSDFYKFIKGFQGKHKDKVFLGISLNKHIPENEYHVEFCFCENMHNNPQKVHVMDTLFYHPAILKIENNNAVLLLKQNISNTMILENIFEFGKTKPYLKYGFGDESKKLRLDDETIKIKLNEMFFSGVHGNQNLQGKLKLIYVVPGKNNEEYETEIYLIIYL